MEGRKRKKKKKNFCYPCVNLSLHNAHFKRGCLNGETHERGKGKKAVTITIHRALSTCIIHRGKTHVHAHTHGHTPTSIYIYIYIYIYINKIVHEREREREREREIHVGYYGETHTQRTKKEKKKDTHVCMYI